MSEVIPKVIRAGDRLKIEAQPDGRMIGMGEQEIYDIDVTTGVSTLTASIEPSGAPYWSSMTLFPSANPVSHSRRSTEVP